MPKGNAPRGNKKTLVMEKMPDGSSSYVRGRKVSDKLKTLGDVHKRLTKADDDNYKAIKQSSGKDRDAFDKSIKRGYRLSNAKSSIIGDFLNRVDRSSAATKKKLAAPKRGK
jgi:hypothetical protein